MPEETALACATPSRCGERLLEGADAWAERQLAGAQHLEHGGLLGLAEDGLRERDDVRGHAHADGARTPRRWPERLGSMPASSESTSASQLASITFSCTPIAPQVSVPSEASSSTRVTAAVALVSSRMRTL